MLDHLMIVELFLFSSLSEGAIMLIFLSTAIMQKKILPKCGRKLFIQAFANALGRFSIRMWMPVWVSRVLD